jgi:hypothetical protein
VRGVRTAVGGGVEALARRAEANRKGAWSAAGSLGSGRRVLFEAHVSDKKRRERGAPPASQFLND